MNKLQSAEQNKLTFAKKTRELIKNTVAVDLNDLEFDMFMYQAQRTGLDPLARQIYAIKNKGKVMIQASIDGLRLVAQRHPDYAGQDEPVWEGEPMTTGFLAKVTVYKFSPNGQRYPAAVGVAYFAEYAQRTTDYRTGAGEFSYMWKKMPRVMIAKVAEALALRKAFPQELSGVYTTEEMDQATTPVKNVTTPDAITQPKIAKEVIRDTAEKEEGITREPTEEALKDEEILTDAEVIFAEGCTCGTKSIYHSRSCPEWREPKK